MRRKRPFTRAERVGSLMHEEVARIVECELRSNLAQHVQVTGATLSGDLTQLKVHWIMRDGDVYEAAGVMLDKAASFVGRALRDTFQMRKTPRVVFRYDAERERLKRVRELLDAQGLGPTDGPKPAATTADADLT